MSQHNDVTLRNSDVMQTSIDLSHEGMFQQDGARAQTSKTTVTRG